MPCFGVFSIIFDTFVFMDDLQIWLYVIIGVIYLLSQVRKKSKQGTPNDSPTQRPAQTTQRRVQPASPSESQKPVSFEDLLREITQAKTVTGLPEYEEKAQPEYADYDDFEEEKTILTRTDFDYRHSDRVYREFEEAKAHDYTKDSLEESMKLEDVRMEFGKFKEFESQQRVNLLDKYTSDLHDPDGLKRAFVLSEVLRPRHF
jgi:hypothetical protein